MENLEIKALRTSDVKPKIYKRFVDDTIAAIKTTKINDFHGHLNAQNPHIQFTISLSHAMRPGLQIRHFWVAKSLFLTITFHQKKQDKTFCF